MDDPKRRPRPSPRLAWQMIDGEAVILDVASARTLGLNPAGALIWTLLPDHDELEIAAALARRFAVDVEAALGDLREFVGDLRARGLLEEA
jgi:coenzyme PQQ synthesis protein D (PqqD)